MELWMRLIQIEIDNGKNRAYFRADSGYQSRFEIHFDVPFSDDPTPSESSITIFNLAKKSIDHIKKGNRAVIHAGYAGNPGILTVGKIRSLTPTLLSGVDKSTTFTILEGEDYSEKKEVDISFGNGATADTIIRRVASDAGIPLAEVKLKNNKPYSSGYTASGQAMGVLQEIAEACDTSIYYRRGQLVIKNFRDGNTERLVLSPSTGLVNQPQRIENDDYSGWSLQLLLNHKITVGTAVRIKSKNVTGNFYVKSGQHSYDGTNFMTTCEVVS